MRQGKGKFGLRSNMRTHERFCGIAGMASFCIEVDIHSPIYIYIYIYINEVYGSS